MGHRFILAMAIAYHRLGSQMGVCQQYQGSPHSTRSALLNTQLETDVIAVLMACPIRKEARVNNSRQESRTRIR
jgi:hypothetical protein